MERLKNFSSFKIEKYNTDYLVSFFVDYNGYYGKYKTLNGAIDKAFKNFELKYNKEEKNNKTKLGRYEGKCLVCGETFETNTAENKTFCSLKCANSYRKKERFKHICPVCGKEFKSYSEYSKYCCVECKNKGSRKV